MKLQADKRAIFLRGKQQDTYFAIRKLKLLKNVQHQPYGYIVCKLKPKLETKDIENAA